jgi:hypothetical protein
MQMTTESYKNLTPLQLSQAADAEINYVRGLGSTSNLLLASGNLGAFEALLYTIKSGQSGVPVYEVVHNVKTRYCGQSGILLRLKAMRDVGIFEERPGKKRSQVCLAASEQILDELAPLLLERQGWGK